MYRNKCHCTESRRQETMRKGHVKYIGLKTQVDEKPINCLNKESYILFLKAGSSIKYSIVQPRF